MEQLPKDWLTRGLIDFEYKKYVIMAYLKDVKENFQEYILFPFLSDLVFHYRNLLSLKENKKLIYDNFPKMISKADFEKLQVTYRKIIEDDEVMQEIEDIIMFSIGKIKGLLDEGKELYDYIEENVEITPIGLSPLYAKEGYLLINQKDKSDLNVYRYLITVFESSDETYRGVHTDYLESVHKSYTNTFEALKLNLIKKYRHLPNPATYLISAKLKLPFNETLFPVAKRLLVKHVTTSGK